MLPVGLLIYMTQPRARDSICLHVFYYSTSCRVSAKDKKFYSVCHWNKHKGMEFWFVKKENKKGRRKIISVYPYGGIKNKNNIGGVKNTGHQ